MRRTKWSLRKRRFVRRMLGYAINPLWRRTRVLLRREQSHRIGGYPVILPPSHDLPFYQRRDPTYDDYAIGLLAGLAGNARKTLVIDVGANVGDTAVAALSAAPSIDVVSVEGAEPFIPYLRRNVAQFGERARVVEGFVGPIGSTMTYSHDGSTGGFQHVTRQDGTDVTNWVHPVALLDLAVGYDQVIWKSDIDGFDIPVLAQHWSDVDQGCQVVWFEYDPASTLGDPDDIDRLLVALGDSGRDLWVYDNLGRHMVDLASGPGAAQGLRDLTRWLTEQRAGYVAVLYLDVWAVPAGTARPDVTTS
jgi:FkbM family methyltransferase